MRHTLTDAILAFVRARGLFPPGAHVLCALSGGPDSVFLTWFLHTQRETLGLSRVSCAHFNHHLRPEADADEAFARDLCRNWGLPFYAGGADVRNEAAAERAGLEETARRLRYAFLHETAQAADAQRIATGHTADDNLETVLLHLVRGAGLGGLTGIPIERDDIVRPLLETTRDELLTVLRAEGIPFREDASNQDVTFARNRLRHLVTPQLASINPRVVRAVSGLCARLTEDEDYLSRQTLAALEDMDGAPSAGRLSALHPALFARAAQILYRRGGGAGSLSSAHVAAVARLCTSGGPHASLDLPGGMCVRRVYDAVMFEPAAREACSTPPFPSRPVVLGPFPEPPALRPDTLIVDGAVDAHALRLRARRPDDVLRLPGKPGRRSLRRLMIDLKVPRDLRDRLPVVTDARDRVIGVFSIGVDAASAPQPGRPAWILTVNEAP